MSIVDSKRSRRNAVQGTIETGGGTAVTTDEQREEQWRRLALRADSMLSLLRHRGGIRWGGPLPEESDVDSVIGALRNAYERGILPHA